MSEQHAAKVCFCSIGRATFVQCSQPEFKEKYLNQLQTSTKLVVTHSTNVGNTDFGLRSRTDSRAAVLHVDRDSQAPACTQGCLPQGAPPKQTTTWQRVTKKLHLNRLCSAGILSDRKTDRSEYVTHLQAFSLSVSLLTGHKNQTPT